MPSIVIHPVCFRTDHFLTMAFYVLSERTHPLMLSLYYVDLPCAIVSIRAACTILFIVALSRFPGLLVPAVPPPLLLALLDHLMLQKHHLAAL